MLTLKNQYYFSKQRLKYFYKFKQNKSPKIAPQ